VDLGGPGRARLSSSLVLLDSERPVQARSQLARDLFSASLKGPESGLCHYTSHALDSCKWRARWTNFLHHVEPKSGTRGGPEKGIALRDRSIAVLGKTSLFFSYPLSFHRPARNFQYSNINNVDPSLDASKTPKIAYVPRNSGFTVWTL
jgi:hypothetical protein